MLKNLSILAFLLLNSCSTDTPRMIDAGALAANYGISRDETRRDFDGKELVVRGYVLSHADVPGDGKPEGRILLGGENPDNQPTVQCWFTQKAASEFGKLAIHQTITVKGVFNGETGAVLKFCSEVK